MGHVKGILGGLLGGIIAAIPWVLVYVYGGWVLSILAALIAIGVSYGYRLFKGTVDVSFPWIIAGTSVFVVIFATLVVIPFLLLANDGYEISFSNFVILYQTSAFVSAIIKDLIISVLFAALGIYGVVKQAKTQIEQ